MQPDHQADGRSPQETSQHLARSHWAQVSHRRPLMCAEVPEAKWPLPSPLNTPAKTPNGTAIPSPLLDGGATLARARALARRDKTSVFLATIVLPSTASTTSRALARRPTSSWYAALLLVLRLPTQRHPFALPLFSPTHLPEEHWPRCPQPVGLLQTEATHPPPLPISWCLPRCASPDWGLAQRCWWQPARQLPGKSLALLSPLRILFCLWEDLSRPGCQGPQRKYAGYLSTTLRKGQQEQQGDDRDDQEGDEVNGEVEEIRSNAHSTHEIWRWLWDERRLKLEPQCAGI